MAQKIKNITAKENGTLLNCAGATPLDEYGYPTDKVHFEVDSTSGDFMSQYKNIVAGTVNINDTADEIYVDDGFGKLVKTSDSSDAGTVDYNTGIFTLTATYPVNVEFKFDIYNINTSRNLAHFQKQSTEVFF